MTVGTYTCERCEVQSPDKGDFIFSKDGTVSVCHGCVTEGINLDGDLAEQTIQSIINLGIRGHLLLLSAMASAWTQQGRDKMDEAEIPGNSDDLAVVTAMFQVSSITEVSLALDAAHNAMKRYELADKVMNAMDDGETCDHPECIKLREARSNAENN